MTNLISNTERLVSWFKDEALPLWSSSGIDNATGGVYERLLSSGEPDLSADRRVRVNYRQMYVFALAHELGWMENAEDLVSQINNFVKKNAQINGENSSFAHVLDSNCVIKDAKQDTYDVAFYLLSCAQRFKAFSDPSALSDAEIMMSKIDGDIKGLNAGWLEGNYNSPVRRQNPHMHLFEAFISLYQSSNDPSWIARAGEIFSMFESHFYEPRYGVLLETFNADWSPQFGTNGHIVEPGHMYEWVWLLHQYSNITRSPITRYTSNLFTNAFKLGTNVTGLVLDEVNQYGDTSKQTKRCWPITEYIKSSLAMAFASKENEDKVRYEQHASRAIDALFSYFLNAPTAGAYFDQLDANDDVITDFAPASTLYHLIVAAKEASLYCNQQYNTSF
ncbi:AGE family epimerase/isomerase [Glaciecola sp. 2405UD65-10]|uniref:AGE family epimerase/isomerase n=1 Tax=Glaciecola sp. 2405UD65-10 TaxID=3397244 RepID=UPI003B58FE9C